MALTKYASLKILAVEDAHGSLLAGERPSHVQNPFVKQAHRHEFEYDRLPGYIYVRSRAISSRCNDNFDEFPAEEIKRAYRTFVGKPVFVNHHNANHRRARGIIIDAVLHEDINPDGSPDTWAEVLMEVDAVRFPRLAEAVIAGDIARTSMGTDVEYSVCTACGNKAYTPAEYCQHIPRMKGMKIRRVNAASGATEEVLIAERCYGLGFFENSLLVEDPADPTAFVLGVDGLGVAASLSKAASVQKASEIGDGYCTALVNNGQAQCPCSDFHLSDIDNDGWMICACGHTKNVHSGQTVAKDVVEAKSKDTSVPPSEHGDPRMQDAGVSVKRTPKGQYYVCTHRARSKYYDSVSDIPQKDIDFIRSTGSKVASVDDLLAEADALLTEAAFFKSKPSVTEQMDRDLNWNNEKVGPTDPKHPLGYPSAKDQAQSQHDYHMKRIEREQKSREDKGWSRINGTGDEIWDHEKATGKSIHDWGQDYSMSKQSTVAFTHDTRDFERLMTHPDYQAPAPPKRHAPHPESGDMSGARSFTEPASQRPSWYGEGSFDHEQETVTHPRRPRAATRTLAYGETKAPAQVDTLRADRCPVCKDDEAFNGEKCSVCGHVEPPAMFGDPDLTKAQEVDLRQDQADATDPGEVDTDPMAGDDEGAQGDLQCTNCGTVFGPDGEIVDVALDAPGDTDDPTDPDEPSQATDEALPTDQQNPEDSEGQDKKPDDLSDLADLDDEEMEGALSDADPEGERGEAEQEQAEQDAAAQDQPPTTQTTDEATGEIGPNMTCPECGQGTLVPAADSTVEQPVEGGSVDMTEQQTAGTNPNPAKQARNRLVAALQEQQGQINALVEQNTILRNAVREIVTAAGIGGHPKFASLMTSEAADVDTSDEQAKQPQAKDDPTSVGAAPAEANTGVTPDAVTDVQNSNVAAAPEMLTGLQDVTAPVPGTDNPTISHGEGEITAQAPSNDVMDPPGSSGWTAAKQVEDQQARFVASVRLARLQISAGIAQGEDMTVAQEINDSALSMPEITASIETLGKVASAQRPQAPGQQHRHLVPQPQRTAAQAAPSFQQTPSIGAVAVSRREGDDEWGLGFTD